MGRATRDDRARLGAPARRRSQRALLRASAEARPLRGLAALAAISYVALPDAPLDYSARAEARLVRAPPSYLREVWHSRHWRLFAVLGAVPLAAAAERLTAIDSDSFSLRAPRAGRSACACASRSTGRSPAGTVAWARAGGWTNVQTRGAGSGAS